MAPRAAASPLAIFDYAEPLADICQLPQFRPRCEIKKSGLFVDSSARADHSSGCRPNANPRSAGSKSHDVRDVVTATNRAVSNEGLQARLGEVFRPKPTLCHQILGRLLHDRVPK